MVPPDLEARQRLQSLLGLDLRSAERAVSEVLDACAYEVNEFITLRHRQLQGEGLDNPEIYRRIAVDLTTLRFKAPAMSPRQIRRRIYG